jgi:hypothetical protein
MGVQFGMAGTNPESQTYSAGDPDQANDALSRARKENSCLLIRK